MQALDLLLNRVSVGRLLEPAPDAAQRELMFRAALRAPDHGQLRPWRFITVDGEARARLGELFAEAHHQLWTALGAVLAVIVLSIPLVIVLARMVAYPLRRLDEAAEAVRRFDFGAPVQVASAI